MKKLTTYFFMLSVAAAILFSACKKSNDSSNDVTPEINDTLSVDLGGYSFVATSVTSYLTNSSGELLVKGANGTLLVVIHLDKNILPGTYSALQKVMYYVDSQHSYSAADGTLIITSHDFNAKTISGTFECTLEDPNHKSVWIGAKKGVFGINYQ